MWESSVSIRQSIRDDALVALISLRVGIHRQRQQRPYRLVRIAQEYFHDNALELLANLQQD